MNVREIGKIPYEKLQEQFKELAHSSEFSAAATYGFNALSRERKAKLIKAFKEAGLDLRESDVGYAVSIIANRMINRE
jgi:hypothetical protein